MQFLCRLEDLENPGSAAFTITLVGSSRAIFLVRRAQQVFAYLNACPHTGGPLDWAPGQFLDTQGEYIQCATHAALFEIDSGYCRYGPCVRRSLARVPIKLDDTGAIWALAQ